MGTLDRYSSKYHYTYTVTVEWVCTFASRLILSSPVVVSPGVDDGSLPSASTSGHTLRSCIPWRRVLKNTNTFVCRQFWAPNMTLHVPGITVTSFPSSPIWLYQILYMIVKTVKTSRLKLEISKDTEHSRLISILLHHWQFFLKTAITPCKFCGQLVLDG